jgi:peptidyl-prolyl cis-trans isomerase B (cyclophilin B)
MNLSIASIVCLLALAVPATAAPPKSAKPATPKKSASAKTAPAKTPAVPAGNPRVAIDTNKGRIVAELYASKAPKTVKNFLDYVKAGHYNGTIFHRVIPGFMIQGGGFTASLIEKPTRGPVPNEADNQELNQRGTLAMARTSDPNSATAQFFINLANNGFLNFRSKTPEGWGYAVFGNVVEGMDVVDAIAQVPTSTKGMLENLPNQPVVIQKVTILPAAKPAAKPQ